MRQTAPAPKIGRRAFLTTAAMLGMTASCVKPMQRRRSPPFRLLYGNDTTHTTSCTSPFHRPGEPFRPELLEASVDEAAAAGADAQALQPGHGRVPMWPSRAIPLAEHYAWIKQRYGLDPDTFGRFALAGGNVVDVFANRCQSRRQTAIVSIRLNDVHNLEFADTPPRARLGGAAAMSLTRDYAEHPEQRIGANGRDVLQRGENWALPAVRERRMALIREVCAMSGVDGIELDFMRFYSLFPQDRTSADERRSIMVDFVRAVRGVLDATTLAGRPRWMGARIPCLTAALEPLGIDPAAMHAAGVDFFNVSASYFTVQQSDFAAIRRLAPEAAFYMELCHSIWNGAKLTPGYDSFTFRRATREQLLTTAHLAYARGASGVSLFNFQYYREHGGPGRGPFHEPPFDVLPLLRDPVALASQPQHYFLAPGWNNPFVRPSPLPCACETDRPRIFRWDLAPPARGWRDAGVLRAQFAGDATKGRMEARINGVTLPTTTDVAEPFSAPYPQMLGRPTELRGWRCTPELLRSGINTVEFRLRDHFPELNFIDLAFFRRQGDAFSESRLSSAGI